MLRCRPQALPRQSPCDEVHKDVSQRLHVVPPTLFDTEVCVDGSVAGSASQVFVFPVRDVLVTPGVPVFLGQAKVNDVDEVAFLTKAPERKK